VRSGSHGRLNLTSDEDLIAACLTGEPAAWDVLVDRYAALIYSIPLKKGFDESDAADVFQAVCIILLDKLGTIRTPRGLPAWIITTTTRQCLALARQRRREQSRTTSTPDAARTNTEPTDPDLQPEEEVLALERHFAVRRAVSELPPPCRRLIEALFSDTAEPLSYEQLAVRLGVSPNSLGPTRARCLAKLRRALIAAGFIP
jgi:RNA polymerase sigma factor (sigma-70 family)